jgi:hypothetical protein
MATPTIIENDAGDRLQLVEGQWRPLANSRAPGATYLPPTSGGDPDKSEAAYWRKYKEADDPTYRSALDGVATARRAEGLLTRQKTGGMYAVPVVGSVMGMFDPEIRELDSIQAKNARQQRTPGEGATSDFDARQFMNMVYGKDKPTETNRAIIQAQRVGNDATIQRRNFMDWYVGTYGTTNGAPEAWSRYAEDNPIFDARSESTGQPALNPTRANWREYFGAVRGPGDKRATQAEADTRRASGAAPQRQPGWSRSLPDPQRKAAMMFQGSKAASGTKGNPFVPANANQFKNIPAGSWYLDDDGKAYRKGAP